MACSRMANYDEDMTEVQRRQLRTGTVRTAVFVAAFVAFLALASVIS